MKNAMIGGLTVLFVTGYILAHSASAQPLTPLANHQSGAVNLVGWGDNGQGGGYGGTPLTSGNSGGGYGGGQQQNNSGGGYGGSNNFNSGSQGGTYNNNSGSQGGTYQGQGSQGGYGGNNNGGGNNGNNGGGNNGSSGTSGNNQQRHQRQHVRWEQGETSCVPWPLPQRLPAGCHCEPQTWRPVHYSQSLPRCCKQRCL